MTRPTRFAPFLRHHATFDQASARFEISLALYPRYLDFMEAHSADDGLPVYDFQSAAGDAVRAADYLLEALVAPRLPAPTQEKKEA